MFSRYAAPAKLPISVLFPNEGSGGEPRLLLKEVSWASREESEETRAYHDPVHPKAYLGTTFALPLDLQSNDKRSGFSGSKSPTYNYTSYVARQTETGVKLNRVFFPRLIIQDRSLDAVGSLDGS